jgi:cytochrome c-type biogenesis protein CcmH
MTRRTLLALLLAVGASTAAPLAAQAPPAPAAAADEATLDRQAKELSSQLRCVVCQGLSIQDSPSSLAQEMRAVVRDQLAMGRTPEQVRAYFVEKYGEFVLLRPDPKGFNLVVYLLPVVMLFGGAGFVFVKARQWTQRPAGASTPEPEPVEQAVLD